MSSSIGSFVTVKVYNCVSFLFSSVFGWPLCADVWDTCIRKNLYFRITTNLAVQNKEKSPIEKDQFDGSQVWFRHFLLRIGGPLLHEQLPSGSCGGFFTDHLNKKYLPLKPKMALYNKMIWFHVWSFRLETENYFCHWSNDTCLTWHRKWVCKYGWVKIS